MREVIATVTSKGQITIPVEVRRRLGVNTGDQLAFVLADDGSVQVRRPHYLTVAELCGAAGTLPEPLPWEEVLAIAHEDQALAKQTKRP